MIAAIARGFSTFTSSRSTVVLGLALLTVGAAQAAHAQGASPQPADVPKAADAVKPAEASKSAAGAAIPVGTTKPGPVVKAAAAQAAGGASGAAGANPAAAAPAPAIDWASMDKKARRSYMKTKVMPEMKKAFQAYDAKHYKNFSCATCHGDGAAKGDYKMPNAKLPKLPKDMAGFKALSEKKPEVMKFMGGVVKPKMATLLGMPEFTPERGSGFGCNACHLSEGQ